MYLWRRSAAPQWFRENEEQLCAIVGPRLAIIERPDRKRLQLKAATSSPDELRHLLKQFGGRVEKLRRDWFKKFLRHRTKPIKIGNRALKIPAGAAFGTGEHATTAMSLQLLKRVFRIWGAQAPRVLTIARSQTFSERSFRMGAGDGRRGRPRSLELVVDLGSGSGILALAAKLLGAARVIGIDNDPIAISTAKQNARSNKIWDVQFRRRDVRHWRLPRKVDVVTANLFSELLIEILPDLKRARWLILSGILLDQERDLVRRLKRIKIDILETRRRGKWVAILGVSR
jgi:ribosomal protein L11 methyltransferase